MTTHFLRAIGRALRLPLALASAPLLLVVFADAHAEKNLFLDGEISYTSDDNVTRAERPADVEEDTFVSTAVGASYFYPLTDTTRLVIRGTVRGEFYNDFDGLSNTTATATVTCQYRGSGAFTEATYAVFAKLGLAEYKSDLRDSNLYSFGVSARKPVTDRITTFTSLSYNVRDSDSTVFDNKETALLANLDYAITDGWASFLTLNYISGDVVSTGTPWLKAVNAAEAINADDAFGGVDGNHFAYRLDAKTTVWTIGTNFKLGDGSSIDVSARWADSEATDGLTYKRQLLSAAYLLRF